MVPGSGPGRSERAETTTVAPAWASASAKYLPTPRLAPVTIATRPSRSMRFSFHVREDSQGAAPRQSGGAPHLANPPWSLKFHADLPQLFEVLRAGVRCEGAGGVGHGFQGTAVGKRAVALI